MSTTPDASRERRPRTDKLLSEHETHIHAREELPSRERVESRAEHEPESAPGTQLEARHADAAHRTSARESAPEGSKRKETFLKKAGREVVEYMNAFKEAWGHGTPLERAAMVVASVFITFSFLPLYIPLGLVVAYSAPELAAPYFIFANDQVLLVIGAAIMLMGPKCIRDLTMKHIKNLVRWIKRLGKTPEQEV